MKLINEFKSFALRGTVTDLAIGVTVGTAFVKIVSTLVNNVIMPPIGLLIGDMDFTHLRLVLKHAGADGTGEVAIGYGLFIQDLINFLLISWIVFLVFRAVNRLRESPHAPPAPPSEEVLLLQEIRDLLRVNKGRG